MIWVNTYGKGRVYENSMGHDLEAMSDPQFQEWMRRGVIWAGNGKLRLRARARCLCLTDSGTCIFNRRAIAAMSQPRRFSPCISWLVFAAFGLAAIHSTHWPGPAGVPHRSRC